jgi:hypothetical protein
MESLHNARNIRKASLCWMEGNIIPAFPEEAMSSKPEKGKGDIPPLLKPKDINASEYIPSAHGTEDLHNKIISVRIGMNISSSNYITRSLQFDFPFRLLPVLPQPLTLNWLQEFPFAEKLRLAFVLKMPLLLFYLSGFC